ncbi:MAG: hypothetical protein U0670_01760 [Anaerolineae bacterium]
MSALAMIRRLMPVLVITIALGVQMRAARAQDATYELRLFRDEDSLTIFIPNAGSTVPVNSLTFATTSGDFPLESYPSFQGLPFDTLPRDLLSLGAGGKRSAAADGMPVNRPQPDQYSSSSRRAVCSGMTRRRTCLR